jgi:hypothetical protein
MAPTAMACGVSPSITASRRAGNVTTKLPLAVGAAIACGGVGAAPFTLLLPQAQKFVLDTLRENVCNVLFWFHFFKASRKLSIFHLSMVTWVFL